MKTALITKIFRFEKAHNLPGHQGKCAHLHGHSYRLEVTLRGPIKDVPEQSDHGMVMDFEGLSRIVRASIIERLDHSMLNESTGIHTPAENLTH
jgi:6-pyruvoyltetrahydropterin/6-carboxytetrahydropterin synthase